MITLLNANALHIPLADKSVQCAATSPPYWGLRDYGVSNQLGLEPTPEEYVSNMVQVFREVWRVLRDDGTLWLNLGDSYNNRPLGESATNFNDPKRGRDNAGDEVKARRNVLTYTLKPKDLVGIPWRVAFALQADGWYLRSDIIWAKPNPMPESVTDRPTKAHEYVFLMSKSQRYYYDADAVREGYAEASLPRALRGLSEDNKWSNGAPGSTAHTMSQARPNKRKEWEAEHGGGGNVFDGHSGYVDANGRLLVNPAGRNRRTVWTIATEPYKGAHFATYPTALVEPCIKAGTSEKGACPKCGKPWDRVVEKEFIPQEDVKNSPALYKDPAGIDPSSGWGGMPRGSTKATTLGWQPACKCDAGDPIPCLVLDPFAGSGTTLLVARELGRSAVGLDLSMSYLREQAYKRLEMHDFFRGQA